jgi:hypothetical protein
MCVMYRFCNNAKNNSNHKTAHQSEQEPKRYLRIFQTANIGKVKRRGNGGYTLITLPRTETPYRDNVDGTRDHVTYQKFVTR